MKKQFLRTGLVIGEEAVNKLQNMHIAVFGIGGVGGYVCEALARAGIEHFDLIDNDVVSVTNINRQIIATLDTVGQYKTEVMKNRILSINDDAIVNTFNCFYLPENEEQFHFEKYDYVVDAIDTMTAKISLVMRAKAAGTPIICAMGTGNKLDPTKLVVTDIYKTEMDPLARIMRRELRKRGIEKLKVVYSTEKPHKPTVEMKQKYLETDESVSEKRRDTPGSTSFVPSAAGLVIASEIIKDLVGDVMVSC